MTGISWNSSLNWCSNLKKSAEEKKKKMKKKKMMMMMKKKKQLICRAYVYSETDCTDR